MIFHHFSRSGIELVLNSKVQSVSKNRVQVGHNPHLQCHRNSRAIETTLIKNNHMMRRTLHACRQATYGQRACKFLNFKNLGYHRVLHETMFDKDIISISNKMFLCR